MSTIERLPPSNPEAEQALLGCVLIDADSLLENLPETAEPLSVAIQPDDFHNVYNRIVWGAMVKLFNDNLPIDLVTLTEVVSKDEHITVEDQIEPYIIGLINAVPTSVNVAAYAQIVKSKSIRRKLIAAAGTIANMAFDETEETPPLELVAKADNLLMELPGVNGHGRSRTASDVAMQFMKFVESKADEPPGSISGLTTGLIDLDRILKGLKPGDLVIFGGRPGMGKTAVLKAIELHNLLTMGKSVASFVLEMSAEQNFARYISNLAKIDLEDVLNGNFRDRDWAPMMEYTGQLSQARLVIDDTAGITVSALRHKARTIKMKSGLDLVTVDYLQLMSSELRTNNREQQVAEISRGLKNLARELDCVVIAPSQLSRAVEQRQDKRPMLSDLRESGSQEQDADVVMFAYRDEYYDPTTTANNIVEINVAKHRNGPTGVARCFWHGKTASVRNLSTTPVNFGEPTSAEKTARKYR